MPFSNVEKQFKYGDLIACSFDGEAFVLDQSGAAAPGVTETFPLMDGSRVRVQPAEGQAYQGEIVAGSEVTSDIDPFAPSFWGSGDGLFGEYYAGSNFEQPAFTRVDSVIMFQQWSKDPKMSPFGVHHLLPDDAYSIRWTGDIEPQHTGPHTFSVEGSGGTRLWIDGVQVIDSWADKSDNQVVVTSTPVDLVQGQKVAIQLEHSNEGGARACMLYWTPPGGTAVFLPQTQTYSGVEIAECAE
jgi:hypothetical protein